MKIESIKFKNYRQYMKTKIDFAHDDDDKCVTVIEAPNGGGKTNIMNSITWCLYGKELHLGDKYKGLPIINTVTLKNMVPNQLAEVEVEITMSEGRDRKIIFRRTLDFRKLAGKDKFEPIKSPNSKSKTEGKLEVLIKVGRDWIVASQPAYRVQRLLPEKIQEYFFFDCERLNEYFKNPYPERIRNEVFKISQLGLFQLVISHLEKRQAYFSRQVKDVSPKAEDLRKLIEKKQEDLNKYNAELDDLKSEKVKIKDLERKLEDQLKNSPYSGDQTKKLQQTRESIQNELESLDAEIKEKKEEQLNYLIGVSPFIMAYEALSKTLDMMTEKTGSGEIPPDYKTRFIKRLLDDGKCICHTDISEDGEARRAVEDLLKKANQIDEISQELIEESNNLSRILSRLSNFRVRQTKYGRGIRKAENRFVELAKEMKQIGEQLEGFDQEEIQAIERRYRMLQKRKEEVILEIGKCESRRESLKKELQKLEKNFENEIAKVKKHEDLKKVLSFCRDARRAAENFRNDVMEEIRAEIEETTGDHFFELIWKRESYKDVKIDENYNISVIDQNGMEAIGTLSAGERQVLALSFMAALNTVSGFDAPIIIDTPLGRISSKPKLNIAGKLPEYLEGKQLSLLVTEEEYTEEVRNRLKIKVGKEYQINFEETRDGNKAEVMPYEI